jgi:flagellar hook assembly protein FlgD
MPPIFSPDNDGFNDVTAIHYKTQEQGLVANVFIFDAAGRLVNHLVRNALLGLAGHWNWNGTNSKGQLLPQGIYIIQAELFNLHGEKHQVRKTVVLAQKLN